MVLVQPLAAVIIDFETHKPAADCVKDLAFLFASCAALCAGNDCHDVTHINNITTFTFHIFTTLVCLSLFPPPSYLCHPLFTVYL